MKKKIHPEYNDIDIVLTDNSVIKTKSCYNKPDKKIKLDVDPLNHPAWQTNLSNFVNQKNDQVSKFNKKFAGIFSPTEKTKA